LAGSGSGSVAPRGCARAGPGRALVRRGRPQPKGQGLGPNGRGILWPAEAHGGWSTGPANVGGFERSASARPVRQTQQSWVVCGQFGPRPISGLRGKAGQGVGFDVSPECRSGNLQGRPAHGQKRPPARASDTSQPKRVGACSPRRAGRSRTEIAQGPGAGLDSWILTGGANTALEFSSTGRKGVRSGGKEPRAVDGNEGLPLSCTVSAEVAAVAERYRSPAGWWVKGDFPLFLSPPPILWSN